MKKKIIGLVIQILCLMIFVLPIYAEDDEDAASIANEIKSKIEQGKQIEELEKKPEYVPIDIDKKIEFTDVNNDAWFYPELIDLCMRNIINGFSDGTFKANQKLTVEQFLKMLVVTVRPESDYTKSEFGDSSWFSPYMRVAIETRILDRELTKEECIKEISRREVADYLYKAAKLDRRSEELIYLLNNYRKPIVIKDKDKIPESSIEGINFLYATEIFTGFADETFKPDLILTRAEATAVIYRIRDFRVKGMIAGTLKEKYNVFYQPKYGEEIFEEENIEYHSLNDYNPDDDIYGVNDESYSVDEPIGDFDGDYEETEE